MNRHVCWKFITPGRYPYPTERGKADGAAPLPGRKEAKSHASRARVFTVVLQMWGLIYDRLLERYMKTEERGSAVASAMLATLLVLLVGATVFLFAPHRHALPQAITAPGLLVDKQYDRTLYVAGVVFVLAKWGLAFAVVRFRERGHFVL
jgi:hypothetical protein